MFLRLNPPPDVSERAAREVAEAQAFHRSRRARLSKSKRQALDRAIRKMVEEHEEKTSGARAKLTELNEFMEGKAESVDFPFGPEASSRLDIRLAASYGRSLRAQFVRAVFADPMRTYVMLRAPGGVKKEDVNLVEAAINWVAENECNLNDELRDSFIPAYRDGTALVHGRWERRVEHGCDAKSYYDAEAFAADYPTAEAAGASEPDYQEALRHLTEDEDAAVHVEYELDFVARNGPKFTVFPLAKFIHYPLYPADLSDMALYGYPFPQGSAAFELAVKHGYYDAEVAQDTRKERSEPQGSGGAAEAWDASRDSLEGIAGGETSAVRYRLAWLVYRGDLDGDGIEERYAVVYDLDKWRSLRVEPYGIRRNIPSIVPFRLARRDGRFRGVSLLGDGEHLFREVNALHRHRSNQRRITDSVTLILPIGLKEHVDLGAEAYGFKPGLAMWVPDNYMAPALRPAQLAIQDTSRTSTSLDEENVIQRYLDLLLGLSQGQSGRESPLDPSAPASKTAMLLQRADIRIEDLVDEWRRTIPDILDLLRALYFQNAGKELPIMDDKGERGTEVKVPIELFASSGIRGVLKPLKATISPEIEMNKIAALAAGALRFGAPVQARPEILAHLWNEFVAASRIERPERFQIPIGGAAAGVMSGGGGQDLEKLLAQFTGAANGQNGTPGPFPAIGG